MNKDINVTSKSSHSRQFEKRTWTARRVLAINKPRQEFVLFQNIIRNR